MARDRSSGSGDASERRQDPLVERLRPDPSQPPRPTLTLAGLLGDSDRTGFRRLYFTRDLGYYAEFRVEDVVDVAPIAADEPPFHGLDATRVEIARDATVEYTHVRTASALGEFDLDVRLGPAGGRAAAAPASFEATCWVTCPLGCIQVDPGTGDTCRCGQDTVQITLCRGRTCVDVNTCETCRQETCQTCETICGQATCGVTCQTCNTRCGQPTCGTCATNCGQATCATCATNCDQATCATCEQTACGRCLTDNPHVFTCGAHRQCL